MEAFKAPLEAGLTAFTQQHEEDLLAMLRNEYERRHEPESFDAKTTRWRLRRHAEAYFWRARQKQETVRAADRRARLQELAKILAQARTLVDKEMDVGDLDWAWWEATSEYAAAEGCLADAPPATSTSLVSYIYREFQKVVKGLAALETAAIRVADAIPTSGGRPKGSGTLPWDDIVELAHMYRNSTGSIPGAGDGPFARFVCKFLTALGRADIEYESMIYDIKGARRWSLKRRALWQSPFDKQTGKGRKPLPNS